MPIGPSNVDDDVDVGARGAHERGLRQQAGDAAAARHLQAHGVGDLRGQRAGLARGLVHRHAHGDAVAHRAQLLDAVDGLLDELEARGGERLDRAHRLVDLPGAVGVQAQLGVVADRRADGGDAPGVVADADLDLHARVALADGARRLRGGLGAVGRGDRGVHAHRARRVVAQQVGDRLALAVAGAVPEREVDGGERLREVVDDRGSARGSRCPWRRRRRAGSARRPRAPRAPVRVETPS